MSTPAPPPDTAAHRSAGPQVGRVVLGIVLVLVGAGWLLDATGAVQVRWSMLLPAVLVVIGVALLATAPRGGSGGLVAAGIAVSVLVLATSVFTAPSPGRMLGVGDVGERPTSADEVEDGFGLGIGSLEVDLRDTPLPDTPVTVEAGVGIGELVILLPDGAQAEVSARAGIGEAVVGDRAQSGVGVEVRGTLEGEETAPLTVEASVGIGKVEVLR